MFDGARLLLQVGIWDATNKAVLPLPEDPAGDEGCEDADDGSSDEDTDGDVDKEEESVVPLKKCASKPHISFPEPCFARSALLQLSEPSLKRYSDVPAALKAWNGFGGRVPFPGR